MICSVTCDILFCESRFGASRNNISIANSFCVLALKIRPFALTFLTLSRVKMFKIVNFFDSCFVSMYIECFDSFAPKYQNKTKQFIVFSTVLICVSFVSKSISLNIDIFVLIITDC